jgi:uncharacterized protein with PIN domain
LKDEPKYCPYCGAELTKHEVECKIDDCGLSKTWYEDMLYCKVCDETYV